MSTNYRQDENCGAAVTQSTQILLDLHDALERLERLEQANGHLRELVQHCSAHWGYSHCGYQHMDPSQRALYDEVIGRTSRSQKALSSATANATAAWRSCEFCGCNTNARERVCCQQGRESDRRSWGQPAASSATQYG
jgi:multidrug resistance efflux pump